MSKEYSLSEEMQSLLHWSSVFSPADNHMDSIRAAYDAMCRHYNPLRDGSFKFEDGVVHYDNIHVPYRLYIPLGDAPENGWPVVFYLHGGGFVVGNLDSHECLTGAMAKDLNAIVMCVDYRLAPEHVFPAAVNDVKAVWQYLLSSAKAWHVDVSRLVVAGDSAGGNLAAVLAIDTQHDVIKPCGQALIYPGLTMLESVPSHQTHANAPMLTYADVIYYRDTYIPDARLYSLPNASPLSAEHFDLLPPAFVGVAEFDPLCDEGKLYCERLTAAGVNAKLYVGKGLLHGAIRMLRDCPETNQLYMAFIKAIKQMLEN